MIRTLEGTAQAPITAEEVERARTRLLNDIEKTVSNVRSLALNLTETIAMGDWRLLFVHRDRLRHHLVHVGGVLRLEPRRVPLRHHEQLLRPEVRVHEHHERAHGLHGLEPLQREHIVLLVRRGLQAEGRSADDGAVELLADRSGGDGRQVLTALEVACALAHPGDVTVEHVEAALGTSALRYGRDDHYDVVSAFIKSMRGGDPQAAIYYLARMLEAGEDARFIARRMVILEIGRAHV